MALVAMALVAIFGFVCVTMVCLCDNGLGVYIWIGKKMGKDT